MARGFGATLGVGATDVIISALTAHATQRTYAGWVYRRNGSSGNHFILCKGTSTTQVERITTFNATGKIGFDRWWSGVETEWLADDFVTDDTWYHLLISYDAGSTTNDPTVYINNALKTVSEDVAPSGTVDTNANNYHFGNRETNNLVFDGALHGWAVWNRILSTEERAILYAFTNPRLLAGTLAEYLPMRQVDSTVTSCVLSNPSVTGTATVADPFTDAGCTSFGRGLLLFGAGD